MTAQPILDGSGGLNKAIVTTAGALIVAATTSAPLSTNTTILDGAAGVNKANVTSGGALLVAATTSAPLATNIIDGVGGANKAAVTSGGALLVVATTSAPMAGTVLDSLGFYVEVRDAAAAVLTITATSTSTQNGVDTSNTNSGALFHIAFTSVVATATVRVMVQAKDPISGRYAIIASVSVDNLSVTSTGNPNQLLYVYPGAINPGGTAVAIGTPLSRVFRVQASITVINLTTTSAVAMSVGMTVLE